ncbi:MAG: hypothetical protein IJM94_00670 [Clostridia bacterium]|nr:hypothetical protein [Clostridia bacterium]MBQ7075291.1 hypothetical protein [Clostridia bacterium]
MRFFKINFEKFLKISAITVFVIVVFMQVVISVPKLNMLFCKITDKEYIQAISESQLVKSSEITLGLIDIQPDNDIVVLLNGEEIAVFNQRTINVSVYDNSVIEIDGRDAKKTFKVQISCNNDIRHNFVETVTVEKNIALVGRIFID